MTRTIKLTAIVSATLLLSSCFSSQKIVGDGAKGNSYAKELNHNMFFGSVKDSSSNPEEMAGTAKNYTITTKQTFGNMVLSVITLGIYTPTLTTVTR